MTRCNFLRPTVLALTLLLAPVCYAQNSVLIDFGNSSSFRGLSAVGADMNGNHWTSVWSGLFYEDVVNTSNTPTRIDVGYDDTSPDGGTDSYNGPAGPTSALNLANDVIFTEIDNEALGNLGGSNEAAFDFYVSSRYQIQQLDPKKIYEFRLFGSHRYNDAGPVPDDVTRYTIYSDSGYSNVVATADLEVGTNDGHNQDEVAVLNGIQGPTTPNNTFYLGFDGANGGFGYLNAMEIVEIGDAPIPTEITVTDFNNRPLGGTFDSWATATITAGADALRVEGTGSGGGFGLQRLPNASLTNTLELDVTIDSGVSTGVVAVLQDGDGTQYRYRFLDLGVGDHLLSFPITPIGQTIGDNLSDEAVAGTMAGLDLTDITAFQIHVEAAMEDSYDVSFNNFRLYQATAVPGDYNGDGVVNLADYTVWRNNLGGDAQAAFPDGTRGPMATGPVGTDDYNFWKSAFGANSAAAISLNQSASVPEPSTFWLLAGVVSLAVNFNRSQAQCLSR
ncbi:Uncharacterized protein SCF082_LOCUS22179 [Durusdinium trenchii]|uniref:PEP-CTERM protein-sorting domain-containing protein n=1 Tax=Durusdinium trenchii TaxID=1381693 RepID=A0ABP0LE94_9DINO